MKNTFKVLMIGQLPKEVGGTYTTGICNVVYELSKCYTPELDLIVYGTNISDKDAKGISHRTVYRGSLIRIPQVAISILSHPIKTIKHWMFYYSKFKANPFRYELYYDNIKRIIEETRPDIIHCMNVNEMSPIYFANVNHIPTVVTLHGIFKDTRREIKNMLGISDYATGLTPETMRDIKSLDFPEQKSFMVPNGVDTSKFYYSDDERKKLRSELGVSEDTTVFLTVGSLQYRKGQLSILHKIINFPETFKYLYLIVGSGPDEDKINMFINDHNISDKVRVIGYMSNTELYKYHSASDVYLHASYEEGQALSEVEAYAADLKIAVNKNIVGTVVTDTTNINDYYLFDYDNFNSEEFITWAAIHKQNRKTRNQYDWTNIYQQYCLVYKKILGMVGE